MVTTASEYFEEVRRAAMDVEKCSRMISELDGGYIPSMSRQDQISGRGGKSDPTADAFDERSAAMRYAVKRRDVCEELIGDALAVIDSLRRIFCSKADVLEMHYIDLKPWREVASTIGISESTARYWRDQLFEWLDACPRAYVMASRYADIHNM